LRKAYFYAEKKFFKKTLDSITMLVYYLGRTATHNSRKEKHMKFDNNRPIYLQIISEIRRDLASGTLVAGQKLPSVRQLAIDYKVNPNTIQRTFRELEGMGMTFTKRGMGTFITEDTEMIEEIKINVVEGYVKAYIESMKALNLSNEEIVEIVQKRLGGVA
jgi:DNA-binding transcriptional regulator YhcF (GntR family)